MVLRVILKTSDTENQKAETWAKTHKQLQIFKKCYDINI